MRDGRFSDATFFDIYEKLFVNLEGSLDIFREIVSVQKRLKHPFEFSLIRKP